MLVHEIEGMEGPQKIIPTAVWFLGCDYILGGFGQPTYFALGARGYEILKITPERKVGRSGIRVPIVGSEATSELVKANAKIMDGVGGGAFDFCRYRFPRKPDLDVLLTSLPIHLGENFVGVPQDELSDPPCHNSPNATAGYIRQTAEMLA